MSKERKYKLFTGTCYTELYKGRDQPRKLTVDPEDRDSFYRHDAVRLSHADVPNFQARPILLEHGADIEELRERFGVVDMSQPVGEIFQSSVNEDGNMRISARIYVDTPAGEKIYEAMRNGDLRGLSVGYRPQIKSGEINYKLIDEVSLCKQPFFEGAQVSVTASNFSNPKREKNHLWFDLDMSQQQQQQQTPPEQPQPIPENKEASDLLRNTDTIAKELAEKEAKIKELMEELAEKAPLANAELARRQEAEKKAEEERIKTARQVVTDLKDLLALGTPEEAALANEQVPIAGIGNSLSSPAADRIPAIMATALSIGLRAAREKEEGNKEKEELKAKIAATASKLDEVTKNSRVTASYRSVVQNSSSSSAKGEEKVEGSIDNIFSIPNDDVLRGWGVDPQYAQVKASQWAEKEKELPKLPAHNFDELAKGGMRGTNQTAFAFMCQNMRSLNQVPTNFRSDFGAVNPPVDPY